MSKKRTTTDEHKLIVHSLRDGDAFCSCGMWSILSTTTSRDTDDYIRDRIQDQYNRHLDSVKRRRERATS